MDGRVEKHAIERTAKIAARYAELSRLLTYPEILADSRYSLMLQRERAALEPICVLREKLLTSLDELDRCNREIQSGEPDLRAEFIAESAALERACLKTVERLGELLATRSENDDLAATLELRSDGSGEGNAFCADLKKMYLRFLQAARLNCEIRDESVKDSGVKSVVIAVSGGGAYGVLKRESGVHKLQIGAAGRADAHCAAVTVAVLPIYAVERLQLADGDVKIDLFHSSGAGGQNVNKVETAVRATHLPTGISVTCQDERSQLRNKERAIATLTEKVSARYRSEREEMQKRERQKLTGRTAAVVRVYNPTVNTVCDLRAEGVKISYASAMNGELDRLTEALSLTV